MLLEEYSGKTTLFTVNGEPQNVTYLTRVDPFSGTVSKISEERAKRRIAISTDLQLKPIDDCIFCDFEQHTPKGAN